MQLECTIRVHQVETLELQFKQERGTNFTTREQSSDYLEDQWSHKGLHTSSLLREPQRL
jgi:hypothetical protein